MARYKPVDPHLSKMLPVRFADQLLPGTFEYAVNWLVDHQIDLSVFDARYRNDAAGATAYPPSVLLKIVLLGYARGLVSSRSIERACRENVVFIARDPRIPFLVRVLAVVIAAYALSPIDLIPDFIPVIG